QFEFRKVFNSLNQFCSTDLSAIYIDATKDRMYCDAKNSVRRRASQTAMYDVFQALAKLLAPILVYTADEAWEHATFTDGSVHEQDFPEPDTAFASSEATAKVNRLLEIRRTVQTAIEEQIQAKVFNKNNEASVTLVVPEGEPVYDLLRDRQFATEFFIIADLDVSAGKVLSAKAAKTNYGMCPRCRRYEPLGKSGLCARCESVVQTVSHA
ncbi:MAG TPA: class I tRNA ligase family protein, partial [Haloferula sp.]